MKLSRIGELSLLEHIRRTFSRKTKDIIVGIGDDAAVVNPSGKRILLTTDMMAEGVHFDLRFVTAYQLGFKLISVNVSDIYAMAGKPSYVLMTIAVCSNTRTEFINDFFHNQTQIQIGIPLIQLRRHHSALRLQPCAQHTGPAVQQPAAKRQRAPGIQMEHCRRTARHLPGGGLRPLRRWDDLSAGGVYWHNTSPAAAFIAEVKSNHR